MLPSKRTFQFTRRLVFGTTNSLRYQPTDERFWVVSVAFQLNGTWIGVQPERSCWAAQPRGVAHERVVLAEVPLAAEQEAVGPALLDQDAPRRGLLDYERRRRRPGLGWRRLTAALGERRAREGPRQRKRDCERADEWGHTEEGGPGTKRCSLARSVG